MVNYTTLMCYLIPKGIVKLRRFTAPKACRTTVKTNVTNILL